MHLSPCPQTPHHHCIPPHTQSPNEGWSFEDSNHSPHAPLQIITFHVRNYFLAYLHIPFHIMDSPYIVLLPTFWKDGGVHLGDGDLLGDLLLSNLGFVISVWPGYKLCFQEPHYLQCFLSIGMVKSFLLCPGCWQ